MRALRKSSLVRLYPPAWRRRYGAEFRALLDDEPTSISLVLDVLRGAAAAHRSPIHSHQEVTMTSRKLQATSGLFALLLVLPALLFLASAIVRHMQPDAYEPARHADQVFAWFDSLHAADLILWAGPIAALVLGLLAVVWRLRDDLALRADVLEFGQVGLRLLRRPALVAGIVAVCASLAVLIFMADHAIAG
jgi:hypothetical protein